MDSEELTESFASYVKFYYNLAAVFLFLLLCFVVGTLTSYVGNSASGMVVFFVVSVCWINKNGAQKPADCPKFSPIRKTR